VDPASVAASVTQRVGASAAVPAAVAAAAGQAAARRHQLIRSILDASDPPSATPAETLLGRPLPSHAAAARAADGLRAIWHPDAAALMAVAGRLTPRAMAAAAAAYPQTAASLRQRLLAALGATDFRRLPMAKRRAIEAILGPALGGPPPSAAYASAMAASVSRKSAPSPGGPPPAPSGQLPPAAMAPSERAAHPGEGR
jgi:hypothetical protein